MDLDKFLAENPAAAMDLKARLTAEFERGKTGGAAEANASIDQRIEKAQPFLNSDYSASIRTLAAGVYAGTTSVDSLLAAAAATDAVNEEVASLKAQLESAGQGSSQSGSQLTDVQKELAEDNAIRVSMGMQPLGVVN